MVLILEKYLRLINYMIRSKDLSKHFETSNFAIAKNDTNREPLHFPKPKQILYSSHLTIHQLISNST